jgi:hypothetical protein
MVPDGNNLTISNGCLLDDDDDKSPDIDRTVENVCFIDRRNVVMAAPAVVVVVVIARNKKTNKKKNWNQFFWIDRAMNMACLGFFPLIYIYIYINQ